MHPTSRALGAQGEAWAAAHLVRRGYRIVARNVRAGGVEIDLVAARPGLIVFVEVKTRRSRALGAVAQSGVVHFQTGFLDGLRRGRYGGVALQRAARESGDPAKQREFLEIRLSDLREGETLIREIAAAVGEPRATQLELPLRLGQFQKAIRTTTEDLEKLGK